jgi:hypothetical protein
MDRPTNLMVINAVELFDEPPDWDRVKQVIQSRLSTATRAFASVSSRADSHCAPPPGGKTIPTSRSSTTCTMSRFLPQVAHRLRP